MTAGNDENPTTNSAPGSNNKDDDSVGRYLTTIIASSIEAVNNRNFDIKRRPWTFYAPSFRNEPDGDTPFVKSPLFTHQQKAMPLSTLLEVWRSLAAACPTYSIEIKHLDVCDVDLVEGKAEVAMRSDNKGIPEGVVRPSVGVMEFRRMGGKWLCTRMRILPGLDFGGGGVV